MKRREFVGAGLALTAAWPLKGWSAILKNVGEVAAKSLDGGDLVLPGLSIEEFAASLRGDLLLQGNPAYDARRRVWNGMFDRKPALIACCTGTSDVRRAVDFAREHRLLTAVRSGGHSISGKSTCDGGLVIDLQSMQGVRVEPENQRAYVEAGSLLGELDHECAAFGVATTAGIVAHTGAAGLTLGGGFGRLGRRFGLSCDNALAFDVVTADGHLPAGDGHQNTDLIWGLRGGGGNFGVVTAIEYRVHRMDPVVLGGYLSGRSRRPATSCGSIATISRHGRTSCSLAALMRGEEGPVVAWISAGRVIAARGRHCSSPFVRSAAPWPTTSRRSAMSTCRAGRTSPSPSASTITSRMAS